MIRDGDNAGAHPRSQRDHYRPVLDLEGVDQPRNGSVVHVADGRDLSSSPPERAHETRAEKQIDPVTVCPQGQQQLLVQNARDAPPQSRDRAHEGLRRRRQMTEGVRLNIGDQPYLLRRFDLPHDVLEQLDRVVARSGQGARRDEAQIKREGLHAGGWAEVRPRCLPRFTFSRVATCCLRKLSKRPYSRRIGCPGRPRKDVTW